MTVLNRIIERKKLRAEAAKISVPFSEVRAMSRDLEAPRNFREAVRRSVPEIRFIAEIKRASPSRGLIRKDFSVGAIAACYDRKPVQAISVLTEEDFFQGSLSFIETVKKTSRKPVLRKDFIFSEYQVWESRSAGADAILLIAAALESGQAEELLHMSEELGMAVLFEIHDEQDLEKALRAEAGIIGINNRNLKTLEIDLTTTLRLKTYIPPGKIIVGESGIGNRQDVKLFQDAGIDAILIGTSIMEKENIGAALDELTADH